MASNPSEQSGDLCLEDDCGKPLRARGFCTACYYRKLRKGDIQTGKETSKWKHRLTEINTDNKTAVCSTCGKTKIFSRGNGQWRCGTEANLRSKLYKQAYRQSKKDMLSDCCEICGSTSGLCWDHCHETDQFRGTLCLTCNAALGLFKENKRTLLAAIAYLEKTNEDHRSEH